MRLINCHDCRAPVSINALACPQCGSKLFAGPRRGGGRSGRRLFLEQRNDRTMIVAMLALGSIGAVYGIAASSNVITESIFGLFYGFVGACIAVPIAFAVNVARSFL